MNDNPHNVATDDDRKWISSLFTSSESGRETAIYSQNAAPILVVFGNVQIVNREQATTPSQQFEQLKKEWLDAVRYTSSLDKIVEHSAYQRIIQMGKDPAMTKAVVGLILADLQSEPKPWFVALHEITGADPIPRNAAGHMKKMVAAWLKWGRVNGY